MNMHEVIYQYKKSGTYNIQIRVFADRIIYFQNKILEIEIPFENIKCVHLDTPEPAFGNIYRCFIEPFNGNPCT